MGLPWLVELAEDDLVTRDAESRLGVQLAAANANLAAFLEQRQATAQRERDLQLALNEAHEQLIRRDEELVGALQECQKQQNHWQEAARLSIERHDQNLRLTAEQQACQSYIRSLTADRDALLDRVERFRRSFWGFLYRQSKPLRHWLWRGSA